MRLGDGAGLDRYPAGDRPLALDGRGGSRYGGGGGCLLLAPKVIKKTQKRKQDFLRINSYHVCDERKRGRSRGLS